jgi:hypothetical protein
MKSFFAFSVFFLFSITSCSGQGILARKFVDHSTVDGVDIQYRWANETRDKNSPLELRLKIKNNNSYPVEISYEIEFYMGPMMEESSELTELCINPKLARTGRINGMYYRSARLTNEQIESKDFSWEISDLKIERVDSCR